MTVLAKVRSPAERAAWKTSGWDPRDGVAELYGVVEPPPLTVMVWDIERLIRPPEDPSLRLLPLDRKSGESVLTQAGWFVRMGALALALLVVGSVGAWLDRRRRAQPAIPKP